MKQGDGTTNRRLGGTFRWAWRLLSPALAVACMGFIYSLSASSPADLPRQVEAFSWLGRMRDVFGHLTLYGLLGTLLWFSVWSWVAASIARLRWAWVAVGVGVTYGFLDEVHQSFVPGRAASGMDVLVDGVGVITGIYCTRYLAGKVLFIGQKALDVPKSTQG